MENYNKSSLEIKNNKFKKLCFFMVKHWLCVISPKKGKAWIVKSNNVKSQTSSEFSKRVGANRAWLIILNT